MTSICLVMEMMSSLSQSKGPNEKWINVDESRQDNDSMFEYGWEMNWEVMEGVLKNLQTSVSKDLG